MQFQKFLKKFMVTKYYEEKIKNLNEKDFEELSVNLSSGVPIATPVFDGASVDDVTNLLEISRIYLLVDKQLYGMEEPVKSLIGKLLSELFICLNFTI